ncbi:MAG: sigma-70 family RNA polymerase sigma factor [Planctomycetia bacterium]|nr:sigma-70 family RNA polymerase sigma factor [Planctomycetia bacterium]
MNAGPLDTLLLKLNEGDPTAAEQVFLAYEPYLRMVVRRRLSAGLRAKFDSVDIVQSVWADLLDGFRKAKWSFHDANQLRGFLVKATHNRFVDRLRQHRTELERERALPQPDIEALASTRSSRVSESFEADELWRQMLEVCPPAHYELLELRRQGASLAAIAARTSLHQSSVRRILYDIARRIALRQAAGTR